MPELGRHLVEVHSQMQIPDAHESSLKKFIMIFIKVTKENFLRIATVIALRIELNVSEL